MRPTFFALLVTLTGCPSDPPADNGERGTTEPSTGNELTTLGDTTQMGTTSAGTSTESTMGDAGSTDADGGASGSTGSTTVPSDDATDTSATDTTDPGTTDTGTTDTGTTDAGTTDTGTTDTTDAGTTDTGPTDPGTTDPGTTDAGTTGTSSGGSTTGGEAIGFQQCDSPDDCLPGEGCLNDDVDNPTVAVCFFEGCVTVDDCPAVPAGGDSSAFCVDVTGEGVDDCVIVCSSTVCPTGMACFLDSICVWPLQ